MEGGRQGGRKEGRKAKLHTSSQYTGWKVSERKRNTQTQY